MPEPAIATVLSTPSLSLAIERSPRGLELGVRLSVAGETPRPFLQVPLDELTLLHLLSTGSAALCALKEAA